jgi:hypothetical protein
MSGLKGGADVGSNHVLVVARVRLSLRARKRKVERRKMDVRKLKNEEIREEYALKVFNRLEILLDKEVDDMDEFWMEYRDAVRETAEEVVGFRKKERKKWISDETWLKIGERKEIKGGINKENIEAAEKEAGVLYERQGSESECEEGQEEVFGWQGDRGRRGSKKVR